MYIQEYGDRAMGLWTDVIIPGTASLVAGLGSMLAGNKMATEQAKSSQDYKNAFNAANDSITEQGKLAKQYTGNEGYANSLEQAGKGAGTIANQAVGTATSGARNAGMSKAQAAQMGLQSGNQAYANAFQNQQGVAQGMGQNAISAQQGITSAQQGQAGQAANERQAQFGRATTTMEKAMPALGDMFKPVGTDVGQIAGKIASDIAEKNKG